MLWYRSLTLGLLLVCLRYYRWNHFLCAHCWWFSMWRCFSSLLLHLLINKVEVIFLLHWVSAQVRMVTQWLIQVVAHLGGSYHLSRLCLVLLLLRLILSEKVRSGDGSVWWLWLLILHLLQSLCRLWYVKCLRGLYGVVVAHWGLVFFCIWTGTVATQDPLEILECDNDDGHVVQTLSV